MNWRVCITDYAKKQLRRFPMNDIRRIGAAIDGFESDPFGGHIEKLSGEINVWRRRIGDYRIKYEIHKNQRLVVVYDIKRRTSTTY